jgi:hypothetical protein
MASFVNIDFPNEFYCPITMDIMKNPVIGPDGHTYERSAIEQWLTTSNKSPITRKVMQSSNLIPNIALRNTIESITKAGAFPTKKPTPVSSSSGSTLDFSQDKVTLSYNSKKLENGNILVNITANPPAHPNCGKRKPSTFICVIDVSGSMDSPVTVSDGTTQESHGFSRLDLVKHSMKTIVNCLGENDHVAIVTFSDTAKVVLDLTEMNELGKRSSLGVIDSIRTEGMTNIWDGLRVALELSKNPICKNSNTVISLLTDGEPNVNPPRGILETLKKTIRDESLDVSISTFGFGYNLDSKLLTDIASEGSGTYGYIPDCTFVGTIFVNFMSNVLASVSILNKLHIKPLNGTIIQSTPFAGLNVGPIQYGQKRDFVLEIKNGASQSEYLEVIFTYAGQEVKLIITQENSGNEHELFVQNFRTKFIDTIKRARESYNLLNRVAESVDMLNDFYREVSTSSVAEDGRLIAILKDIKSTEENEGQIGKSFSRQDWYDKWGKHYVPSVSKAHIYQQCVNFKDPSMQVYGGRLFSEIQEKADDIFCSMPSPTPSCRQQSYSGHGGGGSSYVQPAAVNMSHYYNSGGSCFDGNGVVPMYDGTNKLVKNLNEGDICNVNNQPSKIKCVLRTKVNKNIDLVNINNMWITPWHPIMRNGEWMFPIDISNVESKYIDYVYNFVFTDHHSIIVNGVECIGLGHNIVGPVVSHPYYGTNRVIEDLRKVDGWNNGFIEIDNFTLDRDIHGYISKISPN